MQTDVYMIFVPSFWDHSRDMIHKLLSRCALKNNATLGKKCIRVMKWCILGSSKHINIEFKWLVYAFSYDIFTSLWWETVTWTNWCKVVCYSLKLTALSVLKVTSCWNVCISFQVDLVWNFTVLSSITNILLTCSFSSIRKCLSIFVKTSDLVTRLCL